MTWALQLSLTMADCILDLYRSAVDVGKQWGPDFAAIPAPGLATIPGEDPFLSAASAARAAERAGAEAVALDGLGHWWMLQDLPGRRPSCASSGQPWPDPAGPGAARAMRKRSRAPMGTCGEQFGDGG